MRVVYTIPVRPSVAVPVPASATGIALGGTAISWKVTEGGHLAALLLEFTGAEVRYNENGAILPTYPELEEAAYRVMNYVANRILAQTAFDPFDAESVLLEAPVNSPENDAERELFQTKYKAVWKALRIGYSTHGTFEPASYPAGFNHSAAHGYYADALRAGSEFQKFELRYKVVEYFFAEDGPALDAAVSAHVSPHDPAFTAQAVERLRLLRNRVIHPRARRGHLSPQNIANVREVHAEGPVMSRLADLLLTYPTF